MNSQQILLEVSQKYAELVVLVRRLIATKVEDFATVSQLQTALNQKNQEVASLLQQETETAQIATSLSEDIASLITEASAAIPPNSVEMPVSEETEVADTAAVSDDVENS